MYGVCICQGVVSIGIFVRGRGVIESQKKDSNNIIIMVIICVCHNKLLDKDPKIVI